MKVVCANITQKAPLYSICHSWDADDDDWGFCNEKKNQSYHSLVTAAAAAARVSFQFTWLHVYVYTHAARRCL